MKNKKIIILFIIIFLIILICGVCGIKHAKNKKIANGNEYTPQEEITEEQNRETLVNAYFIDKESNMVKPEVRLVKINDLIKDPYTILIKLLIEGPKNEQLRKIIPEKTVLLKATLEKDNLKLEFSAEFLNYDKNKDGEKDKILDAITKTMTQLNEVNSVEIFVNGNKI